MTGGRSRPAFTSRRLGVAVAASACLVVPIAGTPLLASAAVVPTGSAARSETNLTATEVDLGTLGGPSVAVAVDGSVVVGRSRTASGEMHAFAYDFAAAEPGMIDLGTLGGAESFALDVDGSIVVGRSRTASGEMHAFAYDLSAEEPRMVDLGTLGGSESEAVAVDGNVVVGWALTSEQQRRAFAVDLTTEPPKMLDLGTLGGDWSYAVDVEGSTVVGSSAIGESWYSHAFAYDLASAQPTMTDISHPYAADGIPAAMDGDIVVGRLGPRVPAYDLAAQAPVTVAEGLFPFLVDVDGTLGVGRLYSPEGGDAVVLDLATDTPRSQDFTTLRDEPSEALGISGEIVIGHLYADPLVEPDRRAFVHDLGADRPRTVILGALRDRTAANDIDGDLVVGTVDRGRRAVAWVLRQTTRPMIAFQKLNQVVREDAGRIKVRVTRYGRTDRAVTVRYRTLEVTAKAGKDFVGTSGTLRFAPGVTRRSFRVKIRDDRKKDNFEHLLVTLSRPSKPALLGTPSWSRIHIRGGDR